MTAPDALAEARRTLTRALEDTSGPCYRVVSLMVDEIRALLASEPAPAAASDEVAESQRRVAALRAHVEELEAALNRRDALLARDARRFVRAGMGFRVGEREGTVKKALGDYEVKQAIEIEGPENREKAEAALETLIECGVPIFKFPNRVKIGSHGEWIPGGGPLFPIYGADEAKTRYVFYVLGDWSRLEFKDDAVAARAELEKVRGELAKAEERLASSERAREEAEKKLTNALLTVKALTPAANYCLEYKPLLKAAEARAERLAATVREIAELPCKRAVFIPGDPVAIFCPRHDIPRTTWCASCIAREGEREARP